MLDLGRGIDISEDAGRCLYLYKGQLEDGEPLLEGSRGTIELSARVEDAT